MQSSLIQWFASKFLDRSLSPRELLTVRKVVYTGLIILLFTGSFFWRRYMVETRASELAVREESHGDPELSGSVLRLTLTGSRGLVTCALWVNAMEKQKKNQWNELEMQIRSLTKLQPHFITPWLFQSWNLAYNVSVESDRIFDKYFYITRGIELLAEGERQNRDHPDMRFSIGFYTQHKVCNSDETNVMRSLFQLSCIPPNERDPARFRVGETNQLNWDELEKFCKENPLLVRRLREGIPELENDYKRLGRRQFTCERPEELVQFLRDNWRVPSLYEDTLITPGDQAWKADKLDKKRSVDDRFPVLPPPRSPAPPRHVFQPADNFKELTHDSTLGPDVNGYAVARAWFSYGQEPLPEPDALPGFSKEITETWQRKPRNMTTLIFRNYPPLTQSHLADQLLQEGWFDETPWELTGWFEKAPGGKDKFGDHSPAQLAIPREQSAVQAWTDAEAMWIKHAVSNHLWFDDFAKESNKNEQAEKYWRSKKLPFGTQPPGPPQLPTTMPQRERERRQRIEYEHYLEQLPEEERKLYEAARYMYEMEFYRKLTNFNHHFMRARVEAEQEGGRYPTIEARRMLYLADTYRLQSSPDRARQTYDDPRAIPAWRDTVLSVKDLKKHKEFREDPFIQEQTFEIQLKYLDLLNDQFGRKLKQQVTQKLVLMSLVGEPIQSMSAPAMVWWYLNLADFVNQPGTLAMFKGPFDILIPDAQPMQAPKAVNAATLLGPSLAPAPLLTAVSAAGFEHLLPSFKPLLDPNVVRQVLERKGVLQKPADKPKDKTHENVP